MTFEEWVPVYRLLCSALGRKDRPEQARAYFNAVEGHSVGVVREAVTVLTSRVWDKPTRPNAGDLVDACLGVKRSRTVPASRCDRCHGDRFLVTQCAGWQSGPDGSIPVDRSRLCRRDFPHHAHEDAHPCPQCHPAAMKEPAA